MIRKFTRFSSFVFFIMIAIGHINALAQSVTATATNAACPDEGKITATTSSFTGIVGYQLKQGATIVRPQGGSGYQASNTFEGLPTGTYTVVADNGTSTAESTPVSVTITYTAMSAAVAPATVTCNSATSSLTVAATGGSGNYLYAITPTSTIIAPPAASFQSSPTFTGLAVGSYKFWVKDNTCTSATLINTTGAVNNVPAPDASEYSLSLAPLLSFASFNNHLSGYRVSMPRFIRSSVGMSAADAASYTVEVRNGATVIAGPIAMPTSGGISFSVPSGLTATPLTVILTNTCTGNTKSFPVNVVGPSMTVLASCPGSQAMYRIMANSIVSLPATITYTNQDGSGVGNKVITRTVPYDDYVYVDFPSGTKFDWKIVDAEGKEWTGTHDFTVDLIATGSPSQWTSYVNNCVPNSGTIELIMRGLKNGQTLGFRIISAPAGSESLVGMVGSSVPGWKNDYQLTLNGSPYFPKGAYRIEFIDSGCYNGRQMNVNVQGRTATGVTSVITTANCGSFNFKLAGTYDANYQQYIISGPAGTAGLTKTNTETFTNMPYGTYKVGLRVVGVTSCNQFVQDFTYTAENSIDYDVLNSGGFTCNTGGTGDLIISASTTIPGAVLEYSIDNGLNWQSSNTFSNLAEGTYTVIIRETGCGNQRTVSASVTSNLEATINNQPSTSSICIGENGILNINAIGGNNYTWTYPDGSTHTGKIQNLTNVTPAMAGMYSVVVQSASCTTPSQQVSLKVNTKPTIDAIAAQTACNGTLKTINFTGTAGREYTTATTFTEINTVYNWTNDNPAIGLPASGTGNISFTPTNTGNTPIIANISVTAKGATGCDATTVNFSITVNPDTKIILSSAVGSDAQEKCMNEAIAAITYTITNGTATVTGLPAGLTGNYNAGVFTISGTATEAGNFTYTINATGDCLAATTTGTIKINPNVAIALSSAAATTAQMVNINTAIANITYTLTNGATNATVSGLPTGVTGAYNAGVFTISGSPSVDGTYNYTVSTVGGCNTATINGQIVVNANAAIVLTSATGTNNQILCVSTPLVNINYSITNGTNATATGLPAGVTGTYTVGNFKIAGTPTVAGTFNYTITVTGPGAPATATGTISVTPNTSIALSSAVGSNIQTRCISTAINNISYAISNGTGATVTGLPTGVTGAYSAGVFTISGTPTVSGTFNYTVTATGACVPTTTTGTISVTPNTTIALSSAVGSNTQSICVNKNIVNITYNTANATNVTVTGLPTGVTGNYNAGTLTISGIATATGTFNYTVTANGSCTNVTASGTINVNAFPVVNIFTNGESASISKGDILTLTATGGTTYAWSGADIQGASNTASINVRPKQTTNYSVKVTNASGCTSEQSITINVIEDLKLIPNNIITPNGDGKNDFWVIKNIDYYPNNKVSVYDRAGRRVFAATGYQNNWDGNYAGTPLAEGAYIYVIDMGAAGFGLIRGTINIIRDRR